MNLSQQQQSCVSTFLNMSRRLLSTSLIRLFVGADNGKSCLEDNLEVEPESPVFEIPDVAPDALFHLPEFLGLTTEACDLRPTRDARTAEMAHHVLIDELTIHLRVEHHVGTGTDNTHVALQHIEELWELIDIGLAHELAKRELAWVVLGGLQGVGLVVDMHRTELIAFERMSVETCTVLDKEQGTGTLHLDDQGNNRQEGQQHQTGKGAHDDVEGALQEFVLNEREWLATIGEQSDITIELGDEAQMEVSAHTWHIVEMYYMVVAEMNHTVDERRLVVRQAAEQQVDAQIGLVLVFFHLSIKLLQITQMDKLLGCIFDGFVGIIAFDIGAC